MKKDLNFYDKINNATIERQVEDIYNEGISFYFKKDDGLPIEITYPYSCDGLIETKTLSNKLLKLLMEFKYNNDMSNNVIRAKILIQALFYMKRFEMDGKILPNVILIGDKNECFVLHTNSLIKYLDYDVDWKQSPSTAAQNNPDMIIDIAADKDINPFVFVINDSFSFNVVATKIVELADDVVRYVHVTEHNISRIFDYFSERVIKNKSKISANDLVAIFIGIITNGDNYYTHPKNKNVLVTPFGEITINNGALDSFLKYFNRKYTPQEKMQFTQISDRLIEDTNRRNKGEFYTPTLFVDYAHSMIEKELGENWKDEYVVWDNCCGTLGLTRDYRFKELYCSTLENAELEIGGKYNPEATKFQFDFLNDYIPMPNELINKSTKIPDGLINALKENKPIVFFLNPPYATANNMGTNSSSKEGVAKTEVNTQMLKDNMGACSQNLYAQFVYKIMMIKKLYNLSNCHIALFSPSLFLSGGSYKKFRNKFLNNFEYKDGFLMCANKFADCASNWGINLTFWNNGVTTNKENFLMSVVDRNTNGEVEKLFDKNIYNVDNTKTASEWAKESIKDYKTFDMPNVTSALCIKNDDKTRGTNFMGNLGYFYNAGNNVEKNTMSVSLFSTSFGNGNGHGISSVNFTRCTSLFAARKLIVWNWINSKDEYIAPNEQHEQYKEFENDSIIYSLFNTSSNQSSLRNIEYKNKKWNIKNEFFFMSKSEIETIANDNNNDECYNDVHTSSDRYAYKLLNTLTLSNEAQSVLDKAIDIVIKTFKYRVIFNQEHPEFQINNWDCGWYQIKALAKEYAKNDLEDFKLLYKNLSNKMKPMVYELGFLKQ